MWKQNTSNKPLHEANPFQDKLAIRIAQSAFKLQRLFSSFLACRAASLSSRSLKAATFIICASWIAISTYFIVTAFTKDIPHQSFAFSKIKTMPLAQAHKRGPSYIHPNITVKEYAALENFRNYMDSLRRNLNPAYDSILSVRPGLMDSVQLLEDIYNHPKK